MIDTGPKVTTNNKYRGPTYKNETPKPTCVGKEEKGPTKEACSDGKTSSSS